MSDLIAPVTTVDAFWDPATGLRVTDSQLQAQIVALLAEIRTELRILNLSIQVGLNLTDDLDRARQDPANLIPSATF